MDGSGLAFSWLFVEALGPVFLAIAFAIGIYQWQRRPRGSDAQRDRATKEIYERSDREEARRGHP